MPSTASTSTEIAMKRWRGIMLVQSLFPESCSARPWFAPSLNWSWSGSQLGTNVCDSVRDGDGNELLVFRRHELRNVGPRGGNLDGDCGRGDVIQWTERRCKSAHHNLMTFQLGSHTGGGRLTKGDGRRLSGDPGVERTAVIF